MYGHGERMTYKPADVSIDLHTREIKFMCLDG